jgi:hypothetical protein
MKSMKSAVPVEAAEQISLYRVEDQVNREAEALEGGE